MSHLINQAWTRVTAILAVVWKRTARALACRATALLPDNGMYIWTGCAVTAGCGSRVLDYHFARGAVEKCVLQCCSYTVLPGVP